MAQWANDLSSYGEIFKNSDLFKGIEPSVYLQPLGQCQTVQTECGQTLIAMGSENRNTYLVLSGILTIHLENESNPPIRSVAKGETVGELSLLGETHATAFVMVKKPGKLLEIPREIMWALIRASATLAQNLLFILTDWIISDNERFIDRSQEIENLRGLSQLDGLTGLSNRRALDTFLNRVFTRSQINGKPFSLIMIDVDRFKKYNDGHGHPAGDQALIALSQVLKKMVRPMDFAGRYGGEEFTVILPNVSCAEAVVAAERLRHSIEKMRFFARDGSPLPPITISLGIADSASFGTIEAVLLAADTKLYQAKQEGRNRCCR